MKTYVIIIYLIIIYIIGLTASRFIKNASDYLLGSRRLNSVTTALGAGSADMSAWLMLALPGAVFLQGVAAIWLPIGLCIGGYINWRIVARGLRIYTQRFGNALTIPGYISNRFADNSGILRVTTGIAILIFFTVYISSALVGFAILLQAIFPLTYLNALIFSALVIVIYTIIGGFVAVNWIDVFQGTLMLFALFLVPSVMLIDLGGLTNAINTMKNYDINISNPFLGKNYLEIISVLSWGLGYFGQPHILVRFMATKNAGSIDISRKICTTWSALSLLGAFLVGLLGSAIFHKGLNNPEIIFLKSADSLLPAVLSGVIFAAVLSAIMSTISAQLLGSSSAMVEDIILKIYPAKLLQNYRIQLNRASIGLITIIAVLLAYISNDTILSLVAYAWAGLGCAFGPVIISSLYWKKTTKLGAILGIILGGSTVIIWKNLKEFGYIFHLYEMLPGFLFSILGIILGNLIENYYKTKRLTRS